MEDPIGSEEKRFLNLSESMTLGILAPARQWMMKVCTTTENAKYENGFMKPFSGSVILGSLGMKKSSESTKISPSTDESSGKGRAAIEASNKLAKC